MRASQILSFFPILAPLTLAAPPLTTLTLSDINYSSNKIYSTPAHLATYGGYIDFNVSNSNPAVSYVAHCSARGLHLNDFFYGELVYNCEVPDGVQSVTNFTYSTPGYRFTVNQTWVEDGKTYLAMGAGKADLNCERTEWTNDDWEMGQIYYTENVECETGSLTIVPNVTWSC
ncbi:hypothetical protein CC78DRAFT_534352 [Lojkania enalia]|uniref:AA1-like domain-containing protein n=1 Tax=Lojkania enalia TaxID=147567 RepID=A0A9P4K6P5_9PLEO|nr:hypothetical protein CC78DRAFT_534352 [Didymosphaeria enalia]